MSTRLGVTSSQRLRECPVMGGLRNAQDRVCSTSAKSWRQPHLRAHWHASRCNSGRFDRPKPGCIMTRRKRRLGLEPRLSSSPLLLPRPRPHPPPRPALPLPSPPSEPPASPRNLSASLTLDSIDKQSERVREPLSPSATTSPTSFSPHTPTHQAISYPLATSTTVLHTAKCPPRPPPTFKRLPETLLSKSDSQCLPPLIQSSTLLLLIQDFMSESIWGLLPCSPARYYKTCKHLPEFMLYMHRVTTRGRVDVCLMLAALIYVDRLKRKLPQNTVGDYGFCHKIFTASILIASKVLYSIDPPLDPLDPRPLLTNNKVMVSVIDHVFTVKEMQLMERTLLQSLDYDVWIGAGDIERFLEEHRGDLFLM
ncbi:uncharacterized protein VTP21DRAFT_2999 [Calcarisporiella thermophila]|uniref:uncharacterized protein n=1 Tax=Calcarisporiella thermophila TaxID=911321 RepID=UPI003744851E